MDKSKTKFNLFLNIIMAVTAVSIPNAKSIKLIPGQHKIINANGTVRTESKFYVIPNTYSTNNTKLDETLKNIVDDMSNTTGYVKKTYRFVFGKRKSIRDNENQKFVDLTRKFIKDGDYNYSTHIYSPQTHDKQKNNTAGDNNLTQYKIIELFSNHNTSKDDDKSSQYDNSKNDDNLHQSNSKRNEKYRIKLSLLVKNLNASKKNDEFLYSDNETQQKITTTINNHNKLSNIDVTINNDNLNQNNSDSNNEGSYLIHSSTNKLINKEENGSLEELSVNKGNTNYTYNTNDEANSNKTLSDRENNTDDYLGLFRIDLKNSTINYDKQNKPNTRRNDNLKVIPLNEGSNNDINEEISKEKYENNSKINDIDFGVISASGSTSSIPETYALTETTDEKILYQNSIGKSPIKQNFPDNFDDSYNSRDKIRIKVLFDRGNPSEDHMNTIVKNKMKSQDINEMKNIEKSIHACISRHCNGTEINYKQIKPEYHILVKKVCVAARQNVIDFWKIVGKYLGLEKGHNEDLLQVEKLYVILTVFTQLRRAIEFGYPIEKTIDKIVKILQPSLFDKQPIVEDLRIKNNKKHIFEFVENYKEVESNEQDVTLNHIYKPSKMKANETLEHEYFAYQNLNTESQNNAFYGDISVDQIPQVNVPQEYTPVKFKPKGNETNNLAPETVEMQEVNNQESYSINTINMTSDLHKPQHYDQNAGMENIPFNYDYSQYNEKVMSSANSYDDNFVIPESKPIPQREKWHGEDYVGYNNIYEAIDKLRRNKNYQNPKSHTEHAISTSHSKYYETKPKSVSVYIHGQPKKNSMNMNGYQSIADNLKAKEEEQESEKYHFASDFQKIPKLPYFIDTNPDYESAKKRLPMKIRIKNPHDVIVTDGPHMDPNQKDFYLNNFKRYNDIESTYEDNLNSLKKRYRPPIWIENNRELNKNEKHGVNNEGVSIYYKPKDHYRYPGHYSSSNIPSDSFKYTQFDKKKNNRMYGMLIEEITDYDKKTEHNDKYRKKIDGVTFLETLFPREKNKVDANAKNLSNRKPLVFVTEFQPAMNQKLYPNIYKPKQANKGSVENEKEASELINEIIINLKQHYVPDKVVNDVMQKIYKIIPKANESTSKCKWEWLFKNYN